jgi:ubiquinone/menaquinone biosynthesis C-methylase UbiE
MSNHKHWIKFGFQICKLYLQEKNTQEELTTRSYNKISSVYDEKWTDHMNKFSIEMIQRIKFPKSGKVIDLTCGTGFVTHLISEKSTAEIIGVDISEGMLKIAKKKYGNRCQFVHRDVLDFLKDQPSESVDLVTCAWGLGFLKPYRIIKEVSRILKPDGQLAIIDNSLFTVYEVVFSGLSTVAEHPKSVINVINVRWLPTKGSITRRMRWSGLKIISSWKGYKTYYAKNGEDAINFLITTGTAAGYQFCIDKQYSEITKKRFGEIFKKSYGIKNGIPITHRYIAAIGKKPN